MPATGSDLTYTMRVTSKGPDFGVNVRISDTLPAGTTLVSYDAGGGACTAPPVGSAGTLNCIDHGTAGVDTLRRSALLRSRPPTRFLSLSSPGCSRQLTIHLVECGRRRCRREGLLQCAKPQLCFKGERRGSTVCRQLTLLCRAKRLPLADI